MKTIKIAKKIEAPLHECPTFFVVGGRELRTKSHAVIVGWFACWT